MNTESQKTLLEEFLSSVMNQDEFDTMRKIRFDSLLCAELALHLDYDKSQKSESRSPNICYGSSPKIVKTKNGVFLIGDHHYREGSIETITSSSTNV